MGREGMGTGGDGVEMGREMGGEGKIGRERTG